VQIEITYVCPKSTGKTTTISSHRATRPTATVVSGPDFSHVLPRGVDRIWEGGGLGKGQREKIGKGRGREGGGDGADGDRRRQRQKEGWKR
jgi:hypothetical protein